MSPVQLGMRGYHKAGAYVSGAKSVPCLAKEALKDKASFQEAIGGESSPRLDSRRSGLETALPR